MCYKTLELTLISARDLKNVKLIGKMDVYVVAYLSGDPRSKQKTPVHQDGGTSPRWNHTMRFTIEDSAANSSGLMVVFNLKHEHTFGADEDLGEVRVPVKDLIDGFRSNQDSQVATYQVRRPSGRPKGELNFSYKLNDVVYGQPKVANPYPLEASTSNAAYPPPPTTAYPPTAYPPQQATAFYPPQATAYYPPQPATAYPPQAGGYGYGYGYPVQGQVPQRQRKNGGFGMGMGAGLLGGALGGLLIGDMVSDVYDDGYDAGAADFDMDF